MCAHAKCTKTYKNYECLYTKVCTFSLPFSLPPSLSYTHTHTHTHTHTREEHISPEWARRGMPTFYEQVFEDNCARGSMTFNLNPQQSDRERHMTIGKRKGFRFEE